MRAVLKNVWKRLCARTRVQQRAIRYCRLEVEQLEDRLVPSWAGTPPSLISVPASSVAVTLNSAGDAQGSASVASTEVDYYTFVAPRAGSYFISALTPSSNLDTVLGVFNSSGQRLAYNDDISSFNYDSQLNVTLQAGARYYFGITNYTGSVGGSYNWLVDGPGSTTVDDSYEPNNSFSQAANLGTLTTATTVNGLVMADTGDWFRFTTTATGGSTAAVSISSTSTQGNLNLYLYNASNTLLSSSTGSSNNEKVSLSGRAAGTYYVRIAGLNGATTPTYTLDINPGSVTTTDDAYEQNDSFSQAYNLGTVTTAKTVNSLVMADAEDWFRFTTTSTSASNGIVSISSTSTQGDLDLYVYNSSNVLVSSSTSSTNSEQVGFSGLAAGTYYVRINGYNGAATPTYTLTIDPGSGTTPPPPTGGFQITLTFSGLTASQITIFNQAAARWSQIITGDLPNATYQGQTVDDVLISASGVAIDGTGNVLGQAGPDAFRSGSFLPYHGTMEFDTADLASMQANGELFDVILHEMGHVLGIGTIWDTKGLLSGAGGSNPLFTGAQATAAYNSIFGTSAAGVPVENTGGGGTRDSHWRESVFGNELMTGWINTAPNPLSRVTAASLADLGYTVNMAAADVYTRPGQVLASSSTGSNTSASVRASLVNAEVMPFHSIFDQGPARLDALGTYFTESARRDPAPVAHDAAAGRPWGSNLVQAWLRTSVKTTTQVDTPAEASDIFDLWIEDLDRE